MTMPELVPAPQNGLTEHINIVTEVQNCDTNG